MLLKHDYILIVLILILIAVNNCDRFVNTTAKDEHDAKKEAKKEARKDAKDQAALALLPQSPSTAITGPKTQNISLVNNNPIDKLPTVVILINNKLQYTTDFVNFKDLTRDEIIAYTKSPAMTRDIAEGLRSIQNNTPYEKRQFSAPPYMIVAHEGNLFFFYEGNETYDRYRRKWSALYNF